MAKSKRDRIPFTSPQGVAIYPHIKAPDPHKEYGGDFTCKLRVPAAEAQEFIDFLEGVRDPYAAEEKKKDPKKKKWTVADVYEEELDDDGEETGNLIFKFKLKHKIVDRETGEVKFTQRPAVFDSDGNQLKKVPNVGGGSTLIVGGTVVPYAMAATKLLGVSLRMEGVQILDLVEFGGRDAESFGFGKQSGGYVAGSDADDDDELPDDNVDDADVDEDEEDF